MCDQQQPLSPPPIAPVRKYRPISNFHPFLNHFAIPECSLAAFRRIVSSLMYLARAEEPDIWMLQDDCLLEDFCLVRASMVGACGTLHNDLVVLSGSLAACSHPEYSPGLRTIDRLRVYMQVLQGGDGLESPRKVSALLTQQLDTQEGVFLQRLQALEDQFEVSAGLVSIYRNVRTSNWLAVVQYLSAAVGRVVGATTISR